MIGAWLAVYAAACAALIGLAWLAIRLLVDRDTQNVPGRGTLTRPAALPQRQPPRPQNAVNGTGADAAPAGGSTYRPDPGILSDYHPPRCDHPEDVPGTGMVAGEMPAQAAIPPKPDETPAAGDEAPGTGSLPEGDTPTVCPPQEAPGPGDLPPDLASWHRAMWHAAAATAELRQALTGKDGA